MNLPPWPCSPHARSYHRSCLDLLHTWRGAKTFKAVHYGIIFLLILLLPTSPRIIFLSSRTYTAVVCVVCLTREIGFYTEIIKSQIEGFIYIFNICFPLFFPFLFFLLCYLSFPSCLKGATLSTCRRDLWSKKAGEPSDKRGSGRWKGEIKAMMQAIRALENSERLSQPFEKVEKQ
jgi:hypothetical protein